MGRPVSERQRTCHVNIDEELKSVWSDVTTLPTGFSYARLKRSQSNNSKQNCGGESGSETQNSGIGMGSEVTLHVLQLHVHA